jgi:hypothetical protein
MSDAAVCPIPLDAFDPAVLRNAGDKAPAPLRMMTAKGMAPMAPKELVTAQFLLTFDADEKVRAAATNSLANLDLRIANAVLADTNLNPHVLGHLAKVLAQNDAYAEKLLLNPKTPTEAFTAVAGVCSEQIAEIIANNQARILEVPDIAKALSSNANALRSSVDRVIDFLVRSGKVVEGMKEFEDAFLRLTGEERLKAIENVELPKHLLDPKFLSDEDKEELRKERKLIDDDEEEITDDKPTGLEELLRTLNAAQKVALASKGNKSARTALMRDTNRLVAMAAVTSPGISENEILAAANSRIVHADVIAHICRDKKNHWTRIYAVKLALTNNPKTPLPEAMKLVPLLNGKDQKILAKSRNVPMGVRNLAGKMSKEPMGKGS